MIATAGSYGAVKGVAMAAMMTSSRGIKIARTAKAMQAISKAGRLTKTMQKIGKGLVKLDTLMNQSKAGRVTLKTLKAPDFLLKYVVSDADLINFFARPFTTSMTNLTPQGIRLLGKQTTKQMASNVKMFEDPIEKLLSRQLTKDIAKGKLITKTFGTGKDATTFYGVKGEKASLIVTGTTDVGKLEETLQVTLDILKQNKAQGALSRTTEQLMQTQKKLLDEAITGKKGTKTTIQATKTATTQEKIILITKYLETQKHAGMTGKALRETLTGLKKACKKEEACIVR